MGGIWRPPSPGGGLWRPNWHPNWPGRGQVLPPKLASIPLWYAAWDIDLLLNATLTDNDAVATWKNKGSFGASADLTQAVAGVRPTYKATAGIDGGPAVLHDGFTLPKYLTNTFTQLNKPTKIACVVLTTDPTTQQNPYDGDNAANRHLYRIEQAASTGLIFSGTLATYTAAEQANKFHLHVATYSATAAALRIDENDITLSGSNTGTQEFDGLTLGAQNGGANPLDGYVIEWVCWNGTLPSDAAIEAYFNGRHGAGWPKS